MLMKHKFLIALLLCWPFLVNAVDTSSITSATSLQDAKTALQEAYNSSQESYKDKISDKAQKTNSKKIEDAISDYVSGTDSASGAGSASGNTDPTDKSKLEEKQKAYDEAKANEQSTANKTLTAATTAAMGIGTMELLQGRAEQKADKEAAESMAAYIATMRCTYGEDKQVKAGPDEIELPGGNNQDLMNYRAEYLALANDLKERKTALGMKPGIESEELIDKASTGLYDDENLGITSGAYASLYRAQILGSETDQAKIDEAAKTSKNRVLGGAIAAGAGLVIGVAGNSLINGKLGELIKKKMNKDESSSENEAAIKSLKDGLNQTGMKNVDKLDLSAFDISELQEYIDGTDFSLYDLSNFDATTDIDTTDSSTIESSLKTLLSDDNKRPTE